MQRTNLLMCYFKRNIKVVILLCIFAMTFLLVPFLYNIPIEVITYPLLLCFCAGIIFFFYGFYKFCNKHILLMEISKNPELILKQLPLPKDIIEQDYLRLLTSIEKDRRDKITVIDAKSSEVQEYFTLWAHQIKTPISAIDLLLQSGENNSQELSEQLFKIDEYVGIALKYLRVDSMTSDLVLKNQCLDDIIKQAIHKYASVFIRKKIALNYDGVDCFVLTDEKWLMFVIEQILSNALKYTKSGSIHIYMDTSKIKTLCIEDTGIGIAKEDLPRVFENGFTGYNGRLDKKSTGIGLYLCNRILTRLSHSIEIESTVGKGTRVLIDLDVNSVQIE